MQVGYVVETKNKKFATEQIDNLNSLNCDKIFIEGYAMSQTKKLELQLLMAQLSQDDVIIVDSLELISQKKYWLEWFEHHLSSNKIFYKTMDGLIDTTTKKGREIWFHLLALPDTQRQKHLEYLREKITSERINKE